MSLFLQDFRNAGRILLRHPKTAALAVLNMALGIGLVTCIFAIVDGIFFRGLPFGNGDEILTVENIRQNEEGNTYDFDLTWPEVMFWAQNATSLGKLGVSTEGTVNLSCNSLPHRFEGAWISEDFLDILRISPILGEGFPAKGPKNSALIAHEVWTDCYGSDPDIVGRTVRLNSQSAQILGVLPAGFHFPRNQSVWMPFDPDRQPVGKRYQTFGRAGDGLGLQELEEELNLILAENGRLIVEENTDPVVRMKVSPYTEDFIGTGETWVAATMSLAVLVVLLLACFNVAHLIGSRTTLRVHEFALRAALGARPGHTVRLVLGEALWISIAGIPLGILLAARGIDLYNRFLPESGDTPYWFYADLHPRVLVFTGTIAVLAACLSGLGPALYASRKSLRPLLQNFSRGSTGRRIPLMSSSFLVVEIMMACSLLILAGLMLRSIYEAYQYDLGLDTQQTLIARLALFEGDYPDVASREAFYDTFRERLLQEPGVRGVAFGTAVPLETEILSSWARYRIDPGEKSEEALASARYADLSPNFLETLSIRLLDGRLPETATEVMISRSLMEKYGTADEMLGRKLDFLLDRDAEGNDVSQEVTIVGIVPSLVYGRFGTLDGQARDAIYFSTEADPPKFSWVVLQTVGPPETFLETLHQTAFEIDPNLPLYYAQSMARVRDSSFFFFRFCCILFTVFALSALLLAGVGIYGVTTFRLSDRTRELAIRQACGASRENLLQMILKQSLRHLLIGLTFGVLIGTALAPALEMALFRVRPWDPITILLVLGFFLFLSLSLVVIPARRAIEQEIAGSLRSG